MAQRSKKRLTKAEVVLKQTKEQLAAAQEQIRSQETDINELRGAIIRTQEVQRDLDAQNGGLRTRLEDYRGREMEFKDQISELKDVADRLRDELTGLKVEAAFHRGESSGKDAVVDLFRPVISAVVENTAKKNNNGDNGSSQGRRFTGPLGDLIARLDAARPEGMPSFEEFFAAQGG